MRKTALFFIALSYICFGLPEGSLHAEPYYVGVEGCSCHKSEIIDWERSKHAKAFKLLNPETFRSAKKKAGLDPAKDYTKDDKCVHCHATGYNAKGGFQDLDSTPDLAVIGCEMCHGPGSEYRKLHKKNGLSFKREEAMALGQLYSSLDNSVCRECHLHKDTPFSAEVDEKYAFDLAEAITESGSFHPISKLKGKH